MATVCVLVVGLVGVVAASPVLGVVLLALVLGGVERLVVWLQRGQQVLAARLAATAGRRPVLVADEVLALLWQGRLVSAVPVAGVEAVVVTTAQTVAVPAAVVAEWVVLAEYQAQVAQTVPAAWTISVEQEPVAEVVRLAQEVRQGCEAVAKRAALAVRRQKAAAKRAAGAMETARAALSPKPVARAKGPTVAELRAQCKAAGLTGYSRLAKAQLVALLAGQ